MARYVIYACEQIYGGLHGMNRTALLEGDADIARDEAEALSYEVMDSYHDVSDSLIETAIANFGEDYSDEDFEEVRAENTDFSYYEVREDCNLLDYQIEVLIRNDFYGFVNKYCKKDE